MKLFHFFSILLLHQVLLAQTPKDFSGLNLHTGISYQSPLFKVIIRDGYSYHHSDSKNVSGLGIDLGLNYQFKKVPISLTYFTRLRYDVTHYLYHKAYNPNYNFPIDSNGYQLIEQKGFIFDQHLQVKYHYNKDKNNYIGLTYTFHNPTQEQYIQTLPDKNDLAISFKINFQSFGILAGQHIYKGLFLEEKIGFVHHYFDIKNFNAPYCSFSLKYNFPIKIQSIPKVN